MDLPLRMLAAEKNGGCDKKLELIMVDGRKTKNKDRVKKRGIMRDLFGLLYDLCHVCLTKGQRLLLSFRRKKVFTVFITFHTRLSTEFHRPKHIYDHKRNINKNEKQFITKNATYVRTPTRSLEPTSKSNPRRNARGIFPPLRILLNNTKRKMADTRPSQPWREYAFITDNLSCWVTRDLNKDSLEFG